MKKLIYPLATLVLCTIFFVFSSCHKQQTDPPLQTRIVGKWTMDAAIADMTDYGVLKSDTVRFTSSDYFDLKADGTVAIMADGEAYQGSWTVTGNTVSFINTGYVDFPGGFNVLSLNSSELRLSHVQNNPPDHYLDAKLNFKR